MRENVNPNFIDIRTTGEVFKTVQIGIYRNYVTAEQLKNLSPIYYETLPNGTNRYFTGQFATVEEAEEARDLILSQGVIGAYVLDIEDGKQKREKRTKLFSPRKNINHSFIDIRTTDEFFHTVQIGIYRNYVSADQLQNLDPIYYEKLPNGTNRYFSGHYATLEEAENAKEEILAKDVVGAYVLSIENGTQTSIDYKASMSEDLDTSAAVIAEMISEQIVDEQPTDSLVQKLDEASVSPTDSMWERYGIFGTVVLIALVLLGATRLYKRKS